MSTEQVQPAIVCGKYHFLLRRLHSLTGLIPIGGFLCEHLFTNSAILRGEEHFVHDVQFIRSLPAIDMMELFLIWLPLLFHALLGVVYIFIGTKYNTKAYPYGSNIRYTLQRVTGILALIFILFHMWTVQWGLHLGSLYTPFAKNNPEYMAQSVAYAIQIHWWIPIFYAIGLLSAVYHFANGLWTMAITWGLTITVAAQRRWGMICLMLGIVLAILGIGSLYGFATFEVGDWPEKMNAILGNSATTIH